MTTEIIESKLKALEAEAHILEETKIRLESLITEYAPREELHDERERLTTILNSLHLNQLRDTITELRHDIYNLAPQPDEQGNYTFIQWITAAIRHLGYLKGVQQDYATGSQSDGDDIRAVTIQDIYKWHHINRVPAWAYDQITKITYPTHGGTGPGVARTSHPEWTTVEVNFFISVARQADPKLSYQTIADLCTAEFGRPISIGSIRGMFTRRRINGNLPSRR